MLQFSGSQRVRHNSANELTEFYIVQMVSEFFYPLTGKIPSCNVNSTQIWRVLEFLVSNHRIF